MTGNCGTVHWMAPEVLTNDRYSETADMYRLAVALYLNQALCNFTLKTADMHA